MHKTCSTCQASFEITSEETAFYDHLSPVFAGKKYAIPAPDECPPCRQRHRLAFRNHTAMFTRPSHPEGKTIYSMYPPKTQFPVMTNDDWFSDTWDGSTYNKEYEPNVPVLEQIYALHNAVPRYAAVNSIRAENCDYCNNVSDIKNCYLTFGTSHAEDCMYGESVWGSKDCIDNTMTIESELCYDCINCTRCYNLQSSINCENSSDSSYLFNCRNCKNCFGCANLRNQQYCVWNEQKTEDQYKEFMATVQKYSYSQRQEFNQKFAAMCEVQPRPHTIMHHTEDCTGNGILESKNVKQSNFIQHGENLFNCNNIFDSINDCRDFSFFGRTSELVYNSVTCGIDMSRICFCYVCRNQCADLFYCISCDNCTNCFGCVGLWRKNYCILNKQYTKEEYEKLVPMLIEHMMRDGDWGKFFPVKFNPTPYNRSYAYRYYPLTESEAVAAGYTWLEEDIKEFPGAVNASQLPDGLPDTDDPITVKSSASGRPFLITSKEIAMYRQLQAPLPRESYEERMNKRAQQLGDLELHDASCAKTGKPVLTPYPPSTPCVIWDREVYEETFQ